MTLLQKAAQALLNSWDSPRLFTDSEFEELRKALDAEIAQAEPNFRELNPTLWAFFHQLIHGDFLADNPAPL